jgi:hypothetical protein
VEAEPTSPDVLREKYAKKYGDHKPYWRERILRLSDAQILAFDACEKGRCGGARRLEEILEEDIGAVRIL